MTTNAVFEFFSQHSSLIFTTHDTADADGLGAEMVLYCIAQSMGKQVRIINSSPIPANFRFMDPNEIIETWDEKPDSIPRGTALVIVDTTDEYYIGKLREFIPHAAEVFVIDHHEPNQFCTFQGYIDPTASSTSEMAVELAEAARVHVAGEYAAAAYAGIVYDTGFFAYPKTTSRTFRAAMTLTEAGINPNKIYRELNENSSTGALILMKTILSTLEIHNRGRVAVQILRKEDLEKCAANFEDAENFINIPMKSKEIEVSIFIKENTEGQIRCSLRSKGTVNVSKIAQTMGGGGHTTAAGFKSSQSLPETLAEILSKVSEKLDEE